MKLKNLTRTHKAKLSIFFSLASQAISVLCGLVIPHILLSAYGSEAYGATTSIASFLGYITLLEGGIGAVSRSALYKALADKDTDSISQIVAETKQYFRTLALIFVGYVLILACIYNRIAINSTLEFWFSFSLVLVIAISTFAEYFIGVSYSILIQADQRAYIPALLKIVTTVANTGIIVLLVKLKFDLIQVKLASSIIFIIRPIVLSIIAIKAYQLHPVKITTKKLTQKKTAFGQHLAWVLHNNTDVAVLTVCGNLSLVAVYSVYHMIVSQIQNIVSSFTSGMEAIFGELYVKKELKKLNDVFSYYETLISMLSITLFSVTIVMIIPFVKLYTAHITDADYIFPAFAVMLSLAYLFTSLRTPYGEMVVAAGEFKRTRTGAYGEAIINLVSSIILVFRFRLLGVAIGTVLATAFKWIYYVWFLSKRVLCRKPTLFLRRTAINIANLALNLLLGMTIVSRTSITSYIVWICYGIIVTGLSIVLTFVFNYTLYHDDVLSILSYSKLRGLKNAKT